MVRVADLDYLPSDEYWRLGHGAPWGNRSDSPSSKVLFVFRDGDGAETAVIAGELKRIKARVPVILLVGESQTLVEGVVECADALVARLDEWEILQALEQQAGHFAHAARPA